MTGHTYFRCANFPIRARAGFTLVEILVVVAIIAALGAILWPMLTRAREGGRRAICASNLKQIGLALQQYASDNNRFYPHFGNAFVDKPSHCAWADRILPYIKNPVIFNCPNAKHGDYQPGCPPDSTEKDADGNFLTFDGSYDLNLLAAPGRPFTHESRVVHPVDTISALDGKGDSITPNVDAVVTAQSLRLRGVKKPRHGEGYNVLWMDGHIKWHTIEALLDRRLWIVSNK